MITIDWGTKVINVPKSYLTLISGNTYSMDTNQFRLDLKSLEDDATWMAYLDTHRHNTVVTISGVDYARTFEIINGYTVTFEDGQYRVSLQGTNNNISDVANVNQVSISANNSAGLTDVEVQRSLSFDGAVHIDVVNGQAWTWYPVGTLAAPVNNLSDAISIAQREWFKIIDLLSNLTVTENISWYSFFSNLPTNTVIFTWTDVSLCTFERLSLWGNVNWSTILANQCSVWTLLNVGWLINEWFLTSDISIASDDMLTLSRCFSGVPWASSPVIDMNTGNGSQLNLRSYSWGVEITNCDSPTNLATLEFIAGKATIDSTCTNWFISIRWIPTDAITDNSNWTTIDTNASTINTNQDYILN